MKKLVALCVPLACLLLAAASPAAGAGHAKRLPTLTPVAPDALSRALERGELSEAQYALERARSLFRLGAVRREFGAVAKPRPRDATPILRDLLARLRALSPADRVAAKALLARPSDNTFPEEHHWDSDAIPQVTCDATKPLCVHWDSNPLNADSPPPADLSPMNGIPDAVDKTLATFVGVWNLEIGTYGFLAPLADTTSPGQSADPETDIYLADIGPDGLFGYCTSDDPNAYDFSYPFYDVSAYCVVDDDFANFGSAHTPDEFRHVTVAHEFFHAIQFHYDWLEDLWLMEGTAMVMEDQYADTVNDNVNYLGHSALTSPATPVDRGSGGFEYGAWIFWRFLIEDRGELANPLIIRQIWERAAAASTDTDGPGPDTVASDQYSLQAAINVLNTRGIRFRDAFQKFARVNRFPGDFYSEGNTYPASTTAKAWDLGVRGSTTGLIAAKLNHLSSRYYRLRPGSRTPTNATLRITVDGPSLGSPSALVIVTHTSGPRTFLIIPLNASGNGARTFAFGRGSVSRVDLALTNRSSRMACGMGTDYSCTGRGVDDLRSYSFRATVG
jgi:hypothetical protein